MALGAVGRLRIGVARRMTATARLNVVPLDHLVERRRLDVQQLGGALLYASRRFERRFDQPLLEIGDDFLEGNALGWDDELRRLELRRLAHVVGDEANPDRGARGQDDRALDDVLELADV